MRYKYGATDQNLTWASPKTFKGKYSLDSVSGDVRGIKKQVFVNEEEMK